LIDTRPLVSIVVPAYNHARYLGRAIDSIIAQDYPDVELIVLDDGSTDHTRVVLTKYADKFYWETHANVGQAATLNKGWRMSKGLLLGYLSADDFLRPDAVSTSVAALQTEPEAVVVYCDFELVDPAGKVIRRVNAADFSMTAMLMRFACPPGPGAIFRRSAFERAGGWNPDFRRMPDFDFWLRLARYGHFVHVRQPLAAWRVHEASQSFAPVDDRRAAEPVTIIKSFFAAPGVSTELLTLKISALAQAHLVSAQLHMRSGRVKEAAKNFTAAWRMSPRIMLMAATWRLIFNSLFNRTAHRVLWTARQLLKR
jgi:glycosyltransferase involved in cell wall biosynthesis